MRCVLCKKPLQKIHWYGRILHRCNNWRCLKFRTPVTQGWTRK